MEKVKTALKMCGFSNPTPFQLQVIPAIFTGRDVIAETSHAEGRTITFLLPLLFKLSPKKEFPSAIILTDSISSMRRIEGNFKRLAVINKHKVSLTALGYDENAGKDLALLRRKPDIIVGTPGRIIDHIRRNNLNFDGVSSLIIDVPEEIKQNGFEQDILFVASKLTTRTQFQIFINNMNSLGDLGQFLYHPQNLLYRDRKNFNIIYKGGLSVDKDTVEAKTMSILKEIKANPEVLAEYRKIIKKKVPIFLRSYFAAWLLMESNRSGGMLNPRISQNSGHNPDSNTGISTGKMKTLFISVGRNKRVFPKDLINLFQTTLDISHNDIGSIKVLDNYSFVDIEEKFSSKAVSTMNGTDYRGRKISVDFARKKTD